MSTSFTASYCEEMLPLNCRPFGTSGAVEPGIQIRKAYRREERLGPLRILLVFLGKKREGSLRSPVSVPPKTIPASVEHGATTVYQLYQLLLRLKKISAVAINMRDTSQRRHSGNAAVRSTGCVLPPPVITGDHS